MPTTVIAVGRVCGLRSFKDETDIDFYVVWNGADGKGGGVGEFHSSWNGLVLMGYDEKDSTYHVRDLEQWKHISLL